MIIPMKKLNNIFVSCFFLLSYSYSADWPTWGGDATRNMVSLEKGLDFDFEPGEMNDDETVDMSTTKNIKWVAKFYLTMTPNNAFFVQNFVQLTTQKYFYLIPQV